MTRVKQAAAATRQGKALRIEAAKKKPRKEALAEAAVDEGLSTESPDDPRRGSEINPSPSDGDGELPDGVIPAVGPLADYIQQGQIRTTNITLRPQKTQDIREAGIFAMIPKVYEFSSSLLPTAKMITEQLFGWDPNMPLGVWMDYYLLYTMDAMGVVLQSYSLKPRRNGGNHHDNAQISMASAAATAGDGQLEDGAPWPA